MSRSTMKTFTTSEPVGSRRTLVTAVVALEGVVALAALGGGVSMIANPCGAMGLAPELLDLLPVDSWRLPGVALIVSNAVLPTVAVVADRRGRHWPRRFGHALVGTVVLAWPVTETILFGYPLEGEPRWLRPTVAATGLALIALGLQLRDNAASTHPPDGGETHT